MTGVRFIDTLSRMVRSAMRLSHAGMTISKKVQHFDRKSTESFNHLKCGSVQCTDNCYFFGNSHN